MSLSQQERKEKHFGFMCAALQGLIISPQHYSTVVDDKSAASRACEIADAALAAWEERWKGEGV